VHRIAMTDRHPDDREHGAALATAVQCLRAGGLVAFPTETVYGLGAQARDPRAVARIFAAKGRPADHPLIVHLAEPAQMADWAESVPAVARQLADAFWPGPLTLILGRQPWVPDAVTGGLDTLGLRVPAHPLAQALLRSFGDGVAAPSANRYGRVSPTCAAHVREELGDAVDCLLDGGPCAVGIESTIVDVSQGAPRLLRPGVITAAHLAAALGRPLPAVVRGAAPRAPGSDASHYAPAARVVLAAAEDARSAVLHWLAQGAKVGVLASAMPPDLPASVHWLALPESEEGQAQQLYARLREADHRGLSVVVAVVPPAVGLGLALGDRLRRAAGQGAGFGTVTDIASSGVA
jgi:L-threonylcarbamoyladenylate synthase